MIEKWMKMAQVSKLILGYELLGHNTTRSHSCYDVQNSSWKIKEVYSSYMDRL